MLFVGRIDPIKGIETLVQAAQHVTGENGREPLFLIVGGDLDQDGVAIGPLAEIVTQTHALALSDRFRFTGSQPQQSLPLYYSAADLTVVPSRYESFGLVAVESMACGTPVVASRAGGLTFTIDDGETGLLAPVGDAEAFARAISRLLGDMSLRRRMGRLAHLDAQRFAWSAVAESVLHLYDRLANGHRHNLCCDQEIYA
jgi:D-inositol-3-phosphate glycosyltransferase